MRKTFMLMGLAAAIACGSSAGDMMSEAFDDMTDVPGADAQSPGDGSTMQYVGNSTQTFRGSQYERDETGNQIYENGGYVAIGHFPLFAACQETFGPGHRTCTGDEIRFTTEIPNVEGRAWYGIGSNCSMGNSSDRGAVTASGAFVSVDCDNSSDPQYDVELPVACCGPR